MSTPTEIQRLDGAGVGRDVEREGAAAAAEAVADAIARAIARPVPEVYPYFKSRGLVWLNAVAPGLCDRVVQKFGRKRA